MRIGPIRDGSADFPSQACEVATLIACRVPFHVGKALAAKSGGALSKVAERDINRVLLGRAFTGLLSRMRSFDWQLTHGHQVGVTSGPGALLDVIA